MKKWIIFTGLKTFESSLVVAFLFGMQRLGSFIFFHFRGEHHPWPIDILAGLWSMILAVGVAGFSFVILFGIIPWTIRKNIEWSEKLSNKLKEKTK